MVRGGTVRDVGKLRDRIQDAIYTDGIAVLSVYVDSVREGESEEETVARICRSVGKVGLPHGQVQVAVLSCLLDAGFKVKHEVGDGESEYHHHVYFEEPVTDLSIARFVNCFAQPVSNPAREGAA